MRPLPLLLALSTLAAGCVTVPAPEDVAPNATIPGVDAEGFAPILFGAFEFVEMDLAIEDGLRLHADVYLPAKPQGSDAPTRFPAILLLSPYWSSGTEGTGEIGYLPYDFLVQRLLPRGYAVVFGDLAGNGGSSGCWDFMGPIERRSAVAMVEAVAAQEWSDGKVGMMGLSYDGMTQIMAASDQAPHLVTVVPAAPLTHAYAGLHMAGVHYGAVWHATEAIYESSSLAGPGANTARHPGWIETVAASPRCLADNHAGTLPPNAYSDYYEARDYRPLGADVKASVFYMQGFLDANVKPDNFGAWFDAVPTLKKAWLGHWYHQYPTAQNAGREDMYLTLHRWFDHTLKGIPNGIDEEPAIDVQDAQGRWRHESAWPPADAAPLVLQLSADGALVETGPEAGAVRFGGPLAWGHAARGDGTGAAVFASATLDAPLHVAGVPLLNLTLASDRPAGQVTARLYDVHGEERRLVSRGALNLLYAGGLSQPVPLTPLSDVAAGFEMYPTDHLVPAGHSLELVLSTSDWGTWFDPDASGSILTLAAGESAILTLPTIARPDDAIFLVSCGERLDGIAEEDCWQDLDDQGVRT